MNGYDGVWIVDRFMIVFKKNQKYSCDSTVVNPHLWKLSFDYFSDALFGALWHDEQDWEGEGRLIINGGGEKKKSY